MNRACEHLVGHQNALDGVTLAGRTDWIILDDALARKGLALNPDLLVTIFVGSMSSTRAEKIGLPGKGVKAVMPGIRPLLDALQAQRRRGAGSADRQLRRGRGGSSSNTSICGSSSAVAPTVTMRRIATTWCRWRSNARGSAD